VPSSPALQRNWARPSWRSRALLRRDPSTTACSPLRTLLQQHCARLGARAKPEAAHSVLCPSQPEVYRPGWHFCHPPAQPGVQDGRQVAQAVARDSPLARSARALLNTEQSAHVHLARMRPGEARRPLTCAQSVSTAGHSGRLASLAAVTACRSPHGCKCPAQPAPSSLPPAAAAPLPRCCTSFQPRPGHAAKLRSPACLTISETAGTP